MCKGISGRENVLCLVFSLVQSPADYESGKVVEEDKEIGKPCGRSTR